MGFGKAQVGDKTMIDAIVPFADDLDRGVAAGAALRGRLAARRGPSPSRPRSGTAQLAAKLGRARSHGDKSIGTPDPGAVSFALVVHDGGRTSWRGPSEGTG